MSSNINPANFATYAPPNMYGRTQPTATTATNPTGAPVQSQQQQQQQVPPADATTSFSPPGVQQWAGQQPQTAQSTQPVNEVDSIIGEINQLTAYAPEFMQQQQAGKVMYDQNKALEEKNAQLQQQITMLQNGIPASAAASPADPLTGVKTGTTGSSDPLQSLSSTPPTGTTATAPSTTTLPSGEEDLSKMMNGGGYAEAAAGHASDATDIYNNFQQYAVKADTLYKMKTHYMEEAHTQGLDPASFEGQRYVKEKLQAVVAKDPSLKPAFDKMSLQYSVGQPAANSSAPVSTVLPSTQQAMNSSTSPSPALEEEPLPEEGAMPRSANSALENGGSFNSLMEKLALRSELKQQLAEGKITQKEFDAQTGGQTFEEFTHLK
jgi:hypothetical protein